MSFLYDTWGSSFGVAWGNSWGVAQTSARSGYWRLFFTNMQEESLRKDKEALQEAVAEAVAKAEPKAGQPKPKAKTKLEPLVKLEKFPEVDFKRKPIATTPISVVPELMPWVMGIRQSLDSDIAELQRLVAKMLFAKSEAANDADYRLRILLLAA